MVCYSHVWHGFFFFFLIFALMRNKHQTAISYRRRLLLLLLRLLLLLVAGCGTCTTETRIRDAARAVKMLLFFPPITPPYCSTGLCLYDISQAAGVRVHSQTTRLRGEGKKVRNAGGPERKGVPAWQTTRRDNKTLYHYFKCICLLSLKSCIID